MEERKLTKQDIDKVRGIEGFPVAKDEDIIALSRPPYYTACPNPFIEEFIRENGTPYDEATDDYHREPFAADVSEGKNDPVYMAHSYHTKVPHKAIVRYLLHYTEPGDIVLDGFCGTGMTGVAAQTCGAPDAAFRAVIEAEADHEIHWGARKAILNDLSPAATFIAHNYTEPVSATEFEETAKAVLTESEDAYGWMYETIHVQPDGKPVIGIDGQKIVGRINYTVWSDVFVCPSCSREIVYWTEAIEKNGRNVPNQFTCPHCATVLKKTDCDRAYVSQIDEAGQVRQYPKQIPVMINYTAAGKKYEKQPDADDLALVDKIEHSDISSWYPRTKLKEGEKTNEPIKLGVDSVDRFYTKRNLIVLSDIWDRATKTKYCHQVRWLLTAILMKTASKLHNIGFKNGKLNLAGAMPNALYIPSVIAERNIYILVAGKLSDVLPVFNFHKEHDVCISCGSTSDLRTIPDNSIDYIFTDPPFGANLNYSELSFIWEGWLNALTNDKNEAIISRIQKKGLAEYQDLMERCFTEYQRVLKPNRWITIEFHNSKNAVWNAIQEALMRSGLVVADVRTINKEQGSYNQMTSAGAVQQDLVITAYKPKESFVREFTERAGDPEMAWEFVRQHLRNVPVTADGNHDGKLDIIAERQDYLLFDRMVAWHIMNGIPVPMDAHTFYEGLRQRFLMRDGMFFLPDQVNEYDDKRAHMELDIQQLSFVVTDEKNAIAWLNYILAQGPKTYQEIQPLYMQELHQSRQEKMPELLDMLKENFVQDDKGAWYVPDLSNAADLAKVRRKALLKEFWDSCVPGRGKLKVFRMEAIRAGFDECWKQRDFKTIVAVGEKLPEAVLQEDPALLMYYDNACSRV